MTDLQVFHDLSVALTRLMLDAGTSKHISYIDTEDDVEPEQGKCYQITIFLRSVDDSERRPS